MADERPNPDELLARVQAEEVQASRGKLKIFFGAAPDPCECINSCSPCDATAAVPPVVRRKSRRVMPSLRLSRSAISSDSSSTRHWAGV